MGLSIGALIIGIGFWGVLCNSYNKEPPQKNFLLVIVSLSTQYYGFKSGFLLQCTMVNILFL